MKFFKSAIITLLIFSQTLLPIFIRITRLENPKLHKKIILLHDMHFVEKCLMQLQLQQIETLYKSLQITNCPLIYLELPDNIEFFTELYNFLHSKNKNIIISDKTLNTIYRAKYSQHLTGLAYEILSLPIDNIKLIDDRPLLLSINDFQKLSTQKLIENPQLEEKIDNFLSNLNTKNLFSIDDENNLANYFINPPEDTILLLFGAYHCEHLIQTLQPLGFEIINDTLIKDKNNNTYNNFDAFFDICYCEDVSINSITYEFYQNLQFPFLVTLQRTFAL